MLVQPNAMCHTKTVRRPCRDDGITSNRAGCWKETLFWRRPRPGYCNSQAGWRLRRPICLSPSAVDGGSSLGRAGVGNFSFTLSKLRQVAPSSTSRDAKPHYHLHAYYLPSFLSLFLFFLPFAPDALRANRDPPRGRHRPRLASTTTRQRAA